MKRYKLITCLSLATTLTAGAFAQSAPTAWATNTWDISAAFGLSLAKGNTDNTLISGNLSASKKWDQNEVELGTDGSYGESDGTKSTENMHGFGQYNRLFTERLYGLFRAEGMYDNIAEIDYRYTLSPGAGYYLIKNTNTFLRAEAGPGFVFEKVGGDTESYTTLRLAERFETEINDKVKLWQFVEWLPSVDDFSDYVLNAEIGIETGLTEKLRLRTYVQDTYDSTPAAGRDNNDVKLVVAIAYKFSGK